ncbi:MAG: mechanosensitive ion channel [Methanosarcinaceae archaeon]|nr:mechanosensitive ion channel [Methanosarcinaceae archaeon]
MEPEPLVSKELLTGFLILTATLFILLGFNYLIGRFIPDKKETQYLKKVLRVFILSLGLVFVFLSLPLPEEIKQDFLSLFGIVIGATIALSSSTFIANAMSGLMLHLIKPFRTGDYIESGEVFGRVTDIQLLYTRVQSVERDLITVPNLKLVSHPLKTIRASGTVINTTVSLGYNTSRTKIEEKLVLAAEKTGLENPFVHIQELGDFSVTYKVGGLLKEIEGLISARSDFKKAVLDTLHEAEIEIVSPTFMNQRLLKEDRIFIPEKQEKEKAKTGAEAGGGPKNESEARTYKKSPEKKPEEFIFDKAIEAEILDRLEEVIFKCEKKEKLFEQQINAISDKEIKENLKAKLDFLIAIKNEVKAGFEKIKEQLEEGEGKSDPENRVAYLQSLNLKVDHLYIRRRKFEKELENVKKEEEEEKEKEPAKT